MTQQRIPRAILAKAKTIHGKRSRIVVEHILKYGYVTTEDIEKKGYKLGANGRGMQYNCSQTVHG